MQGGDLDNTSFLDPDGVDDCSCLSSETKSPELFRPEISRSFTFGEEGGVSGGEEGC